ncbi:MAG: 3-hydroxyacyl-CoA dehydrogenase [Chloroflexi bacterium]|nr:MAG: 3-hydroxyacyl-CoA dehydrogenase [Chloroflexota bacterium]RLC95482.1 MAG: 3-hydroxyacyl-CoA dehydrogenase [Chloroflexota bacterium]
MGERLKGKVAVVTGAGRGLGRAEALLLAQEGASVVVNDLGGGANGTGADASPADKVVKEIRDRGGEAVANYDSVAVPEGGENIIKTALETFGRLDILVNNAGVLRDRMVFNMTPEEWDTVLKVHLYGHFHCIRPACAIFRQQRSGRIINTSSEVGLGSPGQANYAAAKEGIVGLTRAVARDMGKYGVTCNAVRPRAATRLTVAPELAAAIEDARARGAEMPVGAEVTAFLPVPDDVVPFVVYLATDEAANINGCTFLITGDQVALYSEPVPVKTIYKRGVWTLDELCAAVPGTLAAGLVNPAPPQPAG